MANTFGHLLIPFLQDDGKKKKKKDKKEKA